ncbi:MAG: phosphotyrosine protein phosphatase [Verrucomicrobiota bacterium]
MQDELEREPTEIVNVLFICSMNKWRSRTAEKIYSKHPLLNVRSAGTSSKARRRVSQADIRWCDLIIFMEEKHCERIRAEFRQEVAYCEMHVLGVEDRYEFMDPRLVEELKAAIDPVLLPEQGG